ncbi:MAG TPA: transcriptional activator RfaH [Verrucomicrobiae bacterium]|nr:transcriptional activator RfaH [Verrucomicrobiae bacterium]
MPIGRLLNSQMQTITQAWYSARTKPKHEHIAAANLRKHLGLDVFSPRLRLEKLTRRGMVSVTEPLFPCYIFVRCVLEDHLNDIQHSVGVNRLVHFGGKIPVVADEIITELQDCFENEEIIQIESNLMPGDEVTVAGGAFAGMSAYVLKNLPAKKRVQILLEILGRPTTVEVEREAVMLNRNSLADMAPALAAPPRRETLSA